MPVSATRQAFAPVIAAKQRPSFPAPFGAEYACSPRWGAWERWYIRLFGFVDLPTRLRARAVTRILGKFPWHTLLDLGSGTGCYCYYLSRRPGTEVWGVDVDPSRIAEAETVTRLVGRENLKFLAASADSGVRRFPAASLDAVLAIEVLQYLPDPGSTLREICRALRPGGIVVAHVPVLGYLREPERHLFDGERLPSLFRSAGFDLVSFAAKTGGASKLLCELFGFFSRWRAGTALVFPLLLLASCFGRGASGKGDYRLLVGRKPAGGTAS